MRTAPTNWAELLAQPHQTETRVDIGGVSYYGYDGESGIWSLATRNALFENFSAGNCHAGTIDLTLVNPQSIPTMAKMEVYVRLTEEPWTDPELLELDEITGAGVSFGWSNPSTVRYSNAVIRSGDTLSLPEDADEIVITADSTEAAQAVLRGKFFEFDSEYYRNGVLYGSPELDVYYFIYDSPPRIRFSPIYFPKNYSVKPLVHHRVTDWVRKGVYYVDTREWDAQHEFLTITGFDAMLMAEQPFVSGEIIGQSYSIFKVDLAIGGLGMIAESSVSGLTTLYWTNKTGAAGIEIGDYLLFSDGQIKRVQSRLLDTYLQFENAAKDTYPVLPNNYPMPDVIAAANVGSRIGAQLDGRSVLDKGYIIQLPAVSSDGNESMTLREVLGYVGAMYGGNWIINDEGKLQLVPLRPSGTAIDIGTDVIDVTTSPAYDAISRVRLVLNEETEYTAGNDTGRTIEIVCPWGTQAMANALLTALSSYAYQPLEATTATKADPLWELGDGVSVNEINSQIVAMPTYFGLAYTVDVSAPNGEEINHEYPFVDKAQQEIKRTVAKATSSLRVDVDQIEAIVSGIAKPYVEGTLYAQNAIVYKDGKYYSCAVDTSSATWVPAEWTEQSSGALSSIIKQTMDSLTFSVTSGVNSSTITITANGVQVAAPVVQFSRIVADSVSASNIEAGTISATSESGAINFNGNFNYYSGNSLAGSLGVMVAAQDLAIMVLGGPPGGATSKTPTITLAQMGVGYSDSSVTQISSHTIRLYGGVTIGDMTDPYADQFTVHDYNELPNPNDYANGTIGIVIL